MALLVSKLSGFQISADLFLILEEAVHFYLPNSQYLCIPKTIHLSPKTIKFGFGGQARKPLNKMLAGSSTGIFGLAIGQQSPCTLSGLGNLCLFPQHLESLNH